MTIQDWGAIGEIVGAAGVIASLLYLALQIRQSSRIARNNTTQAILGISAQMNTHLAGDTSEAIAKLRSGSPLTPEDEHKYSAMLMAVFAQNWQVHYQHSQGMIDPAIFDAYERRLLWFLERPAVRDWWAEYSFRFSDEFKSYVDQHVARTAQQGAAQPTSAKAAPRIPAA